MDVLRDVLDAVLGGVLGKVLDDVLGDVPHSVVTSIEEVYRVTSHIQTIRYYLVFSHHMQKRNQTHLLNKYQINIGFSYFR